MASLEVEVAGTLWFTHTRVDRGSLVCVPSEVISRLC